MEILNYLSSLIYVIPSGIILAAAIILVNRSQTAPGYILLITSIIRIILQVFQSLIPFFISNMGQTTSVISRYYMISGIAGFLNSTVFGIGLILLVTQLIKKTNELNFGLPE